MNVISLKYVLISLKKNSEKYSAIIKENFMI